MLMNTTEVNNWWNGRGCYDEDNKAASDKESNNSDKISSGGSKTKSKSIDLDDDLMSLIKQGIDRIVKYKERLNGTIMHTS